MNTESAPTLPRLALSLCRHDLAERFAGSLLGSLWVLVWPLVQLFIYIVIFGKLMGARLGLSGQVYSYGLYVAAGLLSWTCFSGTLQRTARVFVDKRKIIGKVAVDLRVFPLAICLGELLPFAAGFILLLTADLISGWRPDPALLGRMLLALYCQQVLACGLGLFFACCAVFARDVVEAVAIALQMAFWFTPIVYLPSILPEWLASLLWINPMCAAVETFQKFFVTGGEPASLQLLWLFCAAHASMFLGLFVLRRWQKDIRDVI